MNPIRNNQIPNFTHRQDLEAEKQKGKSEEIITHYLDTPQKKVGAGLTALAIVAVATRGKKIFKYVKNLFSSAEKVVDEASNNLGAKAADAVVEKFKLPEPKFTCGEENPRLYAKEKAEYIKSIWDEFVTSKELDKRIAGLQAIGKYGTIDNINNLGPRIFYDKTTTDAERVAFAKAAAEYGKDRSATCIIKTLKNVQSDTAQIEILKSLIKDLKKEKVVYTGQSVVFPKMVDALHEHPNKQISELAKEASRLIELK